MSLWRLVLALLLGIALPTYGLGAVAMHGSCAVMQKASTPDTCCQGVGAENPQSGHGCAKLCSLGGDCRSLTLAQPAASTPEPAAVGFPFPRASARADAVDPPALWRPPRAR